MMQQAKIRILMVFDALLVGGTETHVLTLTHQLIKSGIHVVVCADKGPLKRDFEKIGCKVFIAPFNHQTQSQGNKSIQSILRQVIKSEGITFIHAHQHQSGQFALQVACKYQIPMAFTVHGTYEPMQSVRELHRRGVHMISVSPPIWSRLNRHNVSSTLIRNGISLSQFYPLSLDRTNLLSKHKIPYNAVVLLYTSRLSLEKAVVCKRVIAASHAVRQTTGIPLYLVIVGQGRDENDLQEYAKSLERMERATFTQFLGTQKSMNPIYAMADCVIGTGRVALEAMACGKPVIAIGSQGLFGLIKPDRFKEAWQYYFGDHKKLHDLSSQKLEHDMLSIMSSKAKQEYYGALGREYIQAHFNVVEISNLTCEVYRKASASK